MKRISNWTLITVLAFSSCAQDFNYDPTEKIMSNAENIFGLIDPNQDWRTVTSGTVTVTANADLDDITKVQILTESPFFNDNAKILAEADATAGQTVTLNYDAPRGTETLIAACVDSKGHHYIKPFDLSTTQVSFATAAARTRTLTRAEAGIDVSHLTLDADSTTWSINAARTIYANIVTLANESKSLNLLNSTQVSLWANSNWENERVWELSTSSTMSNGWNVVNGTVVRNIDPITSDESTALSEIIFGINGHEEMLSHAIVNGLRVDNLSKIRNSQAVTLFNSHLTSDGQPMTLIPVQMASSDMPNCDLYYYYYNPQTAPDPSDTVNFANHIKQLPKFKAIPCNYTKTASGVKKATDLFKVHEYLLPYYGDFTVGKTTKYPTGVYRIRNVGKSKANKNDYITYLNKVDYNCDKLAKKSSTNIANQLFQVYKLENGQCLLYNIGSKKFFTGTGADYVDASNNWGTIFTDEPAFVKEQPFTIESIDENTKRIKCVTIPSTYVGATNKDNNNRIATNKAPSDGDYINWVFEKYEDNAGIPIPESIEIEADPVDHPAVSDCIPAGYKVGFMLRKANSSRSINTRMGYMRAKQNGCTFGYGELNRCINNFPDHFSVAKSTYHMLNNDTRIAMFNANNKTYLAFEDGSDTNFSDLIVELTGLSGKMFDDVQEVDHMPYSMCFEDRPEVADYDMNDVVLRCIRKSSTQLELSLVATGANDLVYIEGIEGTLASGTELNDKEVHELFGVSADVFVNTESSATVMPAVTAVYNVSESTTIPQFLTNIYIRNISQGGNEIRVPKTGQPPYALIVPDNFNYPLERVSIINAYTAFRTWANNAYNYDAWLDSYDESKIYSNPYNR